MKSRKLLSQLSELETALNNFSFEELSAADANRLKKSFDSFKTNLEQKIWGEPTEQDEDEASLHKPITSVLPEPNSGEMLIATVSHEIRTPLNGIIGFTDILKESKLSKDQIHQVNAIQSASHNLLDIINELLEYSKLSAGLEHFEMLDFSFNSIIQDVAYLCNTLMLGKDLKLELEIDQNIPEILIGDPSKLSQVLLNLLGNSIKFVEDGEITLKINLIKEEEQDVWLQFSIIDTGIGISENDLKHIFDSFKQANQHTFSKYGGAGLGLNIVKQIVEKLDGNLEVKSRLGEGTTFSFTLGYKKGVQKAVDNPKEEITADAVKGMRILVFEDNLLNQRLIEVRLKAWGCRTYITENAIYGINLLESTKIDMVLMDLRMPVMSGFEATRRIRNSKNKAVSRIPIVALTADFTIEDKLECEEEGINDYILKPFSPDELLSKLVLNMKKDTTSSEIASPKIDYQNAKTDDKQTIDLTPVLEDCMGEIELLKEMVGLFKLNALEFIGAVKLHLKNKDFNEIKLAAHKVKCGLAMMQTHSLHFIAEQIHNNCRTTKDTEHLEVLYNSFLTNYPIVEKTIDEELLKLMNKKM